MRIISRLLALLLIPFAGQAQTAQVPALTFQLPAVVDKGWSATCYIPKGGGNCSIKMPQRTLLESSLTQTQPTSAPVTMAGAQYTMSLHVPAGSEFIKNPDGTTTVTGVTVTLTPVVKP